MHLSPEVVAQTPAVQAFIEGLRRCGIEASMGHGVVRFAVTAFFGPLAGTAVETGVAISELANWPIAPPHWVHFPSTVVISPTNTQQSPWPGWTMHSRTINRWGNAKEPAQAWIAHVRKILADAQ